MSSLLVFIFTFFFLSFLNAQNDQNKESYQYDISCENENGFKEGYSDYSIHEVMLKDRVRTGAYYTAIVDNPHLFKDKIVLDIGSGTGILSLFAAKAGAKKVYAVEMTKMALVARKIVAENGFSHIIEVIQGRVEDIELPVPAVDVIISEWMGYFLLSESVLPSVLYARDKWLKPEGIIMPDKMELFLCAIEDEFAFEESMSFWKDIYGFSMNVLREQIVINSIIDVYHPSHVISDCSLILALDLKHMANDKRANYISEFEFKVNVYTKVHGILSFFDVFFSKCQKYVGFSTSPSRFKTHWAQTTFYLDRAIENVNVGDLLKGNIKFAPNAEYHRVWDVNITMQHMVGDIVINEQRIERRVGG